MSNKTKCEQCSTTYYSSADDHNRFHMVEIVKGVYLGAMWNSNNINELLNNKIGSIVNAAYEIANKFPASIKYKSLQWDDMDDFEITSDLDPATDFINESVKNNINVLVHCAMGRSRSVSVVVAYLIKYHNMSFDAALKFVKEKKPDVVPNKGFRQQLEFWKPGVSSR